MNLSDGEKIILGLLAVIAGGIAWTAVRASPNGGIRVPSRASEDVNFWYSPIQAPIVGVDQLMNGIAYHPHRYPKLCGGEITTLLHRGWSTVSLPAEGDMDWLSQPPSEVSL